MKLGIRCVAAFLMATLAMPNMSPVSLAGNAEPSADEGDGYASTLLIEAEDESELPEEGEVLGSYEDMYFVGFGTETKAEDLDGASENMAFSIASGWDTAGEAAYEGNAFGHLEDELDGAKKMKGYTVAVIDTGAPEGMEGVSMLGDDGMDRNGHGTAMAEAILKEHPGAKILPIKALDDNGRGDAAGIYAAIQYAIARGADVINLSISGRATDGNQAVEQAVSEAVGKGILVVGAAGNDGKDASGYIPGGLEEVFVIGACGADGKRLASSNYGETVDYYLQASSTSEAAARFSGLLSRYKGDLKKVEDEFGAPTADTRPTPAPAPDAPEETDEWSGMGGWLDIGDAQPFGALNGDGFKTAYDVLIGVANGGIDYMARSSLEENTYLRVYDKAVPVEVSANNFAWGHITDNYADIPADKTLMVSTRPDKRARNGDYVLVKYKGAGKYNKKKIDIHVKLIAGDSTSMGHASCMQVPTGSTHNIYGGWTYWQILGFRVEYSFHYSDTGALAPVSKAYFSWGSINKAEGFLPYDSTKLEYFAKEDAYPNVWRINAGEYFTGLDPEDPEHWLSWHASHTGNWVANFTSNQFSDNINGADFWKSVATVRCTDNDHKFNFYTLSDDFWFAPTFAAPGPVADEPKKYIVSGDERKTTIKGYKGDTITFEIDQGVEIYGYRGEGMMKYSNFSFKDVLPAGLTYKSAKVMKRVEGATSGGSDVTSQGTLTHSGQTVQFKFNSSYLNSGMSYAGETYVLVIKATLEEDEGARPLTNTASTTISNTTRTTNEVTVNQYHKMKTQVRYQKADGTWGDYDTVDTKNVDDGGSYSYTWERPDDRPTNIYKTPDPKTVSKSNIKKDWTLKIDVPRKSYTYKFHANKPSGASGSVTSMPDNITKIANNKCGAPNDTPALKGYTFKGWYDTSEETGGTKYDEDERMVSDKDFYARWKPIKYYVAYNANGGTNYSHEDGEYTQNKTSGSMDKSTYYYDQTGSLRANAYAREGYDFVGWNTKADGSGSSYANGYANVLNWTDEAEKTITLYAQWKKKLGTETLTVVSEETGNRIPGVTVRLYKKVNGTWTDTGKQLTTNAQGQVSVSNLHWFDYEWRSVSVPAGYKGMTSVGFSVYPNCTAPGSLCTHTSGTRPSSGAASLSLAHTRILYMKHVSLTLDSRVSEVIKGENPPAFVYHVEGRDAAGVNHAYDVMVQVGPNLNGTNRVPDLFAGTYTVTQTPVSRYVPGSAEAVKNATVSGINVTENLLNVDNGDFAEIRFPYTIRQVGGFGSMHSRTNQLAK